MGIKERSCSAHLATGVKSPYEARDREHRTEMLKDKKTQYRPDIDVLRAISIFVVTFFHLSIPGFSGGFIGVDIFFVISGFLMTSIICEELRTTGRLNFLRFCERRMRRILPALLTTLAAVTLVAFFIPISGIEAIRAQIISSAMFTSNFYFWSVSGYFDTAAITKPLLHTWSLAVETQFYLIWPIFIAIVWKFRGIKVMPLAIAVSGIASFVAGLFFTSPDDLSTLFYMTPFRIFEFAIGGLLYFERWAIPLGEKALRLAILVCVGVIAACTFVYDDKMVFPAWNALLPCGAAAGFILFGKRASFPFLFHSRPLLMIGRLSYSIYLVHWPIIVFYPHLVGNEIDWMATVIMLASTLAVSAALHFSVEHRFHRRSGGEPRFSIRFGNGASFATATLTAFAFFTLAMARPAQEPSSQSLDVVDIQRSNEGYTWRNHRALNSSFQADTDRDILIIGDSQAADMVNLLLEYDSSLRSHIRTFVSTAGCQIKLSDTYYQQREQNNGRADETIERCRKDRQRFHEDARIKAADAIVLAYSWRPAAIDYLDEDIAELSKLSPRARIYVAGLKTQPRSGIWYMEQGIAGGAASTFAKKNAVDEVQQINTRLATAFPGHFLDLQDVTCSRQACDVFTDSGYPIFFDTSHLTAPGARYLATRVPFYTLIGTRLQLAPAE
jgi:peptidoglycan/LPS O-acetylase OafA/YrhL